MSIRRVVKGGRVTWHVQVITRRPDGRKERARRVCARQDEARKVEAELRAATRVADEPPQKEVPTLAAFAVEYITHCETTNRGRYARIKALIIRGRLLPAFGHLRLDQIGRREIENFRTARAKEVAAKTVNNEIGILLHMLSTAHEFEIIGKAPKVRPLKAPLPEVEFLSDDEQQRLVAAAEREGGPWAAMIRTGLRTGLRLGELRALRWKDADLVAGRIVVRHAADDRNVVTPPKNGKPREVPLCDEAIAALRDHKHLRGPLVFCDDDGSMLPERRCGHVMERLMLRASLATGDGQWHLLRHTFASELVQRSATLKAVQELLGHQSLAMVLRYAHLSPDARREAVRLLDRPSAGATRGATLDGKGV